MTGNGISLPDVSCPPGWIRRANEPDRIVFTHQHMALELLAERTPAEAHPALDLGTCWRLRARQSVGEHLDDREIAHVPTRETALRGLRRCMRRIERTVEDPDPVSVRRALSACQLSDIRAEE